jgi:hypothetical protein
VIPTPGRPNPQQVARAGEHYVAAELHRRGAYAVTFAGNMPEIDLLACDRERARIVAIQIKTKRSGDWQTDIRKGRADPIPDDTHFWVLVDLGSERPSFYIIPEAWMQKSIYDEHQAYLARHGGHRARNPRSTHHRITNVRVHEWRDRWDLLGIF